MGRNGHTLGTLLPSSPEATRFRGYFGISAEVAVEAWEMMEELDCLPPHHLSFDIICGHSHLCDCTKQMIVPFLQIWGGLTRRQFENISGQ